MELYISHSYKWAIGDKWGYQWQILGLAFGLLEKLVSNIAKDIDIVWEMSA